MQGTTTTAAPTTEAAAGVIVLADARSAPERELIAAWARTAHPGAPLLDRDEPALVERLDAYENPLVVPARVTWLPPPGRERSASNGANPVRHGAGDLLALVAPRRPWAPLQSAILQRRPDRARVTAGEPALLRDMHRRFHAEAGPLADAAAFGGFVVRQAVLACDRAERAMLGDRYKVPRLVAEQITTSARFRAEIAELADALDREPDGVAADATRCLSEIAAVQSPIAIDAFRTVMSPLHARAWTVDADVESLGRLRELNRSHALIFLPSHRSYADPLVLAEVLHAHDFPRNHLLGGNNMAFWPIGPLGRRAGVIFIRRSFGDDRIYKLAVREYFGHLLSKRFNLEWYVEGGRTRTGKLRPPRFGLLHYLVRALEHGPVDDVMLVPTSIVYDQLQEIDAMATEHHGGAKQAEGLRWLADYVRGQRRNVGAARVRFGEPFSLRGALAEAGEGPARLEKVAFAICDGINRATPVTGTSLLTLTLLGVRDRALTFDQVRALLAPLLDDLERRGVPGAIGELRRAGAVRHVLDRLVSEHVVERFDGGTEPVWSIAPGRHHVAAFYRNGALHHMVNRAIVELVLLGLGTRMGRGDAPEDPVEAGWRDGLALRDLLKFEFFFSDKRGFQDQLADELALMDPDWAERVREPAPAADLLASQRSLIAHRALRSFLDAQLVVARRLAAHDPREPIERKPFLEECIGVGRQLLLQGRLHSAESVSQELFSSALRLAANRDLVDAGRDELRDAREAFLAEIEEVLDRVRRIGELDQALLEEVLDGDAG